MLFSFQDIPTGHQLAENAWVSYLLNSTWIDLALRLLLHLGVWIPTFFLLRWWALAAADRLWRSRVGFSSIGGRGGEDSIRPGEAGLSDRVTRSYTGAWES